MIQFLFAVWALADLVSYYLSGTDTVGHLADLLGWTGNASDVTFVWGMSFIDFIISNWMYISCAVALILMTAWIAMRPFDKNGKIIWGIRRAHRERKERRLRGARST